MNADTLQLAAPKRCWFQFRLWAVLILVVTTGVAVDWFGRTVACGVEAREPKDEDAFDARVEIAAKIESLTGAYAIPCDRLKSPDDIYVGFRKVKSADAALKAIAGSAHLGELVLEGTNLTDAGMNYVSAFTKLQRLDVSGTMITDAGVKNLEGLTRLKFLDLHRTQITNAGLKRLENLKQLEFLTLYKTAITNDGLKSLKGLSKLDELWIDSTKVTDAGVADLQKALPKCTINH
jgi:hypothetical protein